jgi:hypothetical protein
VPAVTCTTGAFVNRPAGQVTTTELGVFGAEGVIDTVPV